MWFILLFFYIIGIFNIIKCQSYQKRDIEGVMIMSNLEEKGNIIHDKKYHHALSVISKIPYNITKWTGVFTNPCPGRIHKAKYQHGLALAHFRIWYDFSFFPQALINQYNDAIKADSKFNEKPKIEFRSQKSFKGAPLYVIDNYGNKYKDGQLLSGNDVLMIFEDDATIHVNETLFTSLLAKELQFKTDVHFLGYCTSRKYGPVCAHAYAVTRDGAKKLIQYWDICGEDLDVQIPQLASERIISRSVIAMGSWRPYTNCFKCGIGEGLFRQTRDFGHRVHHTTKSPNTNSSNITI